MVADGAALWVALAAAALIALAAHIFYVTYGAWAPGGKETFAPSAEAFKVAGEARALFDEFGGRPPYAEYKARVARDPVQFDRVRSLYRKNMLSPEAVQQYL